MVKQVGLLPAGCQPWNNEVCAASGDRFAYCATLAIYVYQLDKKYNQFRLTSILSEHKKTVSAIAWNPKNSNIFASASYENKIIIWDICKEKPIAIYQNVKVTPVCIDWCSLYGEAVSYIFGKGPLLIWSYQVSEANISTVKESCGFSSDVTCFKWHPKNTEKVAFGHKDGTISFCTVGSKSQRHLLKPDEDNEDSEDDDCVVALEWDPLSVDYLLLSNAGSGVRLVDSVSFNVIMIFQLPSAASKIKAISWVNSAPGMFITGDALSGIIRVWNVSKETPVENIRVKKTGFHALKVICDKNRNGSKCTTFTSSQTSSTSMAQNPVMVNSSNFAIPPAQVVCTFTNGGVGLYDLGRRKWEFLREEGHVETIFDCKFCPDNSNLLATGSFDGTIKVWDITSFTSTSTSPGNEGIIYSISWAPSDLNCIVAATSKCGIFIWDLSKSRIIKRFNEHGKNSVYTVVWNQQDSKRIMSCGADENCIIRQIDGDVIQKYKHPGSVYGCDWNPHNKDMLATGCDDNNVRIFCTSTSADQPLKVFSGHTAKVFHVKWSPLKENLLCSGSDDHSIRMWDYSQDACIITLLGHNGPVRGLVWNTEIPYLVISGSWDSTIRMWDIRDGACIDTILDHGADVYGLTSHPSRPFILASSSRDSTVRLWSLTNLIQPIEMNILVGKPWSQILGSVETVMALGSDILLTGRESREVKIQAEEFSIDAKNRLLKLFSKFFMAPAGTDNLWELISVAKGLDDALLSPNYSKGIMHVKHLIKYYSSEAQQLEMAKLTKSGGGVGTRSKEERLRDAAQLHLQTGNLQRYCELMVELGEWERALAVAPGVTYDYWKNLAARFAKFLVQEESDQASVFCTAAGETKMLVDFYIARGQMSEAVLSAQVACEGLVQPQYTEQLGSKQCNGWKDSTQEQQKLLHHTVNEWAEWYFTNASPIQAACCHLAVDKCQEAMCKLIQGNELELAVAMGMVLSDKVDLQWLTNVAIEMLSRRCEKLGKWYLALDLLHLIPNNKVLLAKCCARCSGAKDKLNVLHQRANLPLMENCLHEAEKLKRSGNTFEIIMFYLLSSSPKLGIDLGINHVKKILKSDNWTVQEIFDILQLLGCAKTEVIQVHSKRVELLAMCAYIGALVAMRRGYNSIVSPLFQNARSLAHAHSSFDIGVPESVIQAECTAWNIVHLSQPNRPVNMDLIPDEHKSIYMTLQQRAGHETNIVYQGPDCVANTHLPSHSDIHVSCLTGERIQGLAYFLEDGKSALSANEAMMWAKVNPFTPLQSGYRMNPF